MCEYASLKDKCAQMHTHIHMHTCYSNILLGEFIKLFPHISFILRNIHVGISLLPILPLDIWKQGFRVIKFLIIHNNVAKTYYALTQIT